MGGDTILMRKRKRNNMNKLLNQVAKHIDNLQWELDRMGQDGREEYDKLVTAWNKLRKEVKNGRN